jgi:hypothetical protein
MITLKEGAEVAEEKRRGKHVLIKIVSTRHDLVEKKIYSGP